MSGRRLIRLDWAIKNILREKANFDILEGFLSELLRFDVTISEILESEGNRPTAETKTNRVDILVRNSAGQFILIEIQSESELDFLQRIVFASSKLITEHIHISRPYSEVVKVYTISIVYFDLGQGSDYIYHGTTQFVGLHKKDKLGLDGAQRKMFKVTAPEDLFPEHYLIKVPRFDNTIRDTLDEWIYFLKNESIQDNFKAKGIKAAHDKLEVMKLPPEERRRYNNYLEDLHYEASMAFTRYTAPKELAKRDALIEQIRTYEAALGKDPLDQEQLDYGALEWVVAQCNALWKECEARGRQAESRAEQEKQRAEQEKQRAEEAELRAKEERQRAEEERQRAEEAELHAKEERQRAEEERQRAAEAEQRAEKERDALEARIRDLEEKLRRS